MDTVDYFRKQNELQEQAYKILEDLKLINFLKKIGKPKIVGSLALGLMSCEDIDIVVDSNPDAKSYLKTVDYLFRQKNVYNLLVLQDFRKSIYPDRPQGLYLGVTYLVMPNIFWKIDIWFMKKSKALEVLNFVKSKLTDENRLLILKIKNQMREKIKDGEKISGGEVYDAVLKSNVKNLKGFKKYLKEKGI